MLLFPRSLLIPALPLAIALLAGCAATSSAGGGAAATAPPAHSSPAQAPAAPSSASASPVQPASPPTLPATLPASPVVVASTTITLTAPEVFLAESGSVGGTSLYRPACASGCGLSGDGTTALWNMTWSTWNSAEAAGTGTEKIDDCNPNCAAGTLHPVAVRVTLSKPVMTCQSGKATWYWTRVTFTWPNGLPAVFSGDNAPTNPFDYPEITAQQAKSCS
jgi:hypothetical protein